ncbi:ABC transporter ATP-binding protein [Billgrantia endophytica]|uniref:ABC transporter ATP-binding protein n=1 Tax=Billgrantia endophytica TaxID=2033802 RepID=A0A2N7U1M2_9GAMM|nr:ABC transporter ATP-binding protein [Halomonas endophytica]PMR74334.1 ABC transporter ATP-binding protein [Halomonas endophytica]
MEGLSIEGVGKRFGDQHAVRSLSLEIEPGEFVALLGPSGCGKTTMLRMLAGFERVSAGRIALGGRLWADTTHHLPPEQRNMGMVFQSYALWPHMNVADNVGYPVKLRGIGGNDYRRRVREALALVRLEAYAERSPQELSGGQRQRVALARCLVTSPSVVLLDEPLANLDRHLRASMEECFRDFHHRTGATLVYVTHDQSEAMSLADRIAVMKAGELVQWATPETLYRQPRSEWLAGFIGDGSVLSLPGGTPGQVLATDMLMSLASQASGAGHQPVLVRPEHVQLGEQGLNARVERSIFRGERYELSLRLADLTPLVAYSPRAIAEGSEVKAMLTQGWCLEADA